jgi:hypothetical protein
MCPHARIELELRQGHILPSSVSTVSEPGLTGEIVIERWYCVECRQEFKPVYPEK